MQRNGRQSGGTDNENYSLNVDEVTSKQTSPGQKHLLQSINIFHGHLQFLFVQQVICRINRGSCNPHAVLGFGTLDVQDPELCWWAFWLPAPKS